MASPDWLQIFRNWEAEKLQAHIDELEKQISVFSTQQVGSKSYVKDLGELRGQLSAAYQVKQERAHRGNRSFGVTDFSRRGCSDDPRIP